MTKKDKPSSFPLASDPQGENNFQIQNFSLVYLDREIQQHHPCSNLFFAAEEEGETIRNISHSPSDENRWNFHYFIYFSPFSTPPRGGKTEGKGMVGSTLVRSPHTFSSMCGLFRNCSAGKWWWVRGKFTKIYKYKTDVPNSQEKILSWSKHRLKNIFLWQIPRRAKKG